MDMCYDGTLVMPSSYAVMEEDEMSYVDGGFYITRNQCATVTTYISMITGLAKTVLAVMALGTLAAKIAGKALPIMNKLTSINLAAKIIGVVLTTIAAIEVASLCNGILTADRLGTGVEMKWRGVFTGKNYR